MEEDNIPTIRDKETKAVKDKITEGVDEINRVKGLIEISEDNDKCLAVADQKFPYKEYEIEKHEWIDEHCQAVNTVRDALYNDALGPASDLVPIPDKYQAHEIVTEFDGKTYGGSELTDDEYNAAKTRYDESSGANIRTCKDWIEVTNEGTENSVIEIYEEKYRNCIIENDSLEDPTYEVDYGER